MSAISAGPAPETTAPLAVLCVDDEPNILNALRRLLRPHGYTVLTASSGAEGLAIVEAQGVDLVLSDMRMPEMNGAQFLSRVKDVSPGTVRILLTGHADLSSTIAAINSAEIYRYISKPWDDETVLGVVKETLERKVLLRETERLERLTRHQNLELKALNSALESKVQARTADLASALRALEDAHANLKKSFTTSLKVFSNLIELREGAGGRSRRVADLARKIAQHLKLGEEDVQDVTLAGLLHGIGKFGLTDGLLRKPISALDEDERRAVTTHPVNAQTALIALEQLAGVGKLIRSYRERYDGMGYPDRLSALVIPVGARILALAHDYESAQDGGVNGVPMSKPQAREYIFQGRGNRYDPAVVDAFAGVLKAIGVKGVSERALVPGELREGMVLTRDLVTADGILLLSKDQALDTALIARLRRFEARDGQPIRVYIRAR